LLEQRQKKFWTSANKTRAVWSRYDTIALGKKEIALSPNTP
jgi:hypothetical protein